MSDVLRLPAEGLDLTNTTALYALVEHARGCPMAYAEPVDQGQRVEHYRAPLPLTPGRPDPGAVIVVRCADCGRQVIIDPRGD